MVFDANALHWFATRTDPSRALDGPWSLPSWAQGAQSLEAIFGLDRTSHFLRHHRGLFPQLWERQITQSLRALLLEDPARTHERCQALLDALQGGGICEIGEVDRITADAADRMDLAVHFRDADQVKHCVVIEAKLEHELSDNQLGNYRRRLLQDYPRPEQRHLFVIAPRRTARTDQILGRTKNQEWSFATWRQLLLAWQRALPDNPGHDVLSLFSEIWKRVKGR